MIRSNVNWIPKSAGLKLTAAQLDRVVNAAFSTASPTFRSGKTDEWTKILTRAQIEKIDRAANDALVSFGYA